MSRFPSSRTLHAYGTAIAACAALGLAVQSCGVMSSGDDCSAKATCTDDGGGPSSGGGSGGGSGSGAGSGSGSGGVGGDDGSGQGDVAGRDVTSENAMMGDGMGDNVISRDATSEDAGSGDVTIKDVAMKEAARVDGCVPTGPEICTNGIDDDCDGLIDCADPACAAYKCAAPVPGGWMGPVVLWQATNPAVAPGCQPSYGNPLDRSGGLNAPQAICGSCTCSASGQTCSAPGAFHPDQACNNATCASVTPASDGSCTSVPSNSCGSGGSFTMGGTTPTPTGGSCGIASAGSVTVPPASWATSARVCSYIGPPDSPGGCTTAGDLCVAAPTGNYGTALCVYSAASPAPSSCPAGYTRTGPSVFYSGDSDTRACGGCTCAGAPSGGSCSGSVSLYGTSAGGCTGTPAAYSLGMACQCYGGCGQPALSPVPGYVRASYTVTGGTCSVAAQPSANGSAAPTGPTTVCCM